MLENASIDPARLSHRYAGALTFEALSDGQLLEWFVRRGEEAAFAALVRRHGPMVLGVCRRVLRHAQDAEDAFQATFLVLAQKAPRLRRPELLANWLYGVAYRTALHARQRAAQRSAREREAASMSNPENNPQVDSQELRRLLDEELIRLPERYRVIRLVDRYILTFACTPACLPTARLPKRAMRATRVCRGGSCASCVALGSIDSSVGFIHLLVRS
jgi:RNA polymerase sigma factor (sigma-70 family)